MPLQASNQLYWGTTATDWRTLTADATDTLSGALRYQEQQLFFVVASMAEAVAAAAFAMAHRLDWGVIEQHRLTDALAARLTERGVLLINNRGAVVRLAGIGAQSAVPGRITVLTSGTTGTPKLIAHTSESLNTFGRVAEAPANTWFVPYQIGSYAWFQMVMLGAHVAQQHLLLPVGEDVGHSFQQALAVRQVTAVSSTPTFWRHVLMTTAYDVLQQADLRSISLGGEIVDQTILDSLAALYPAASIRHIYASSEAGAAIVVTDRQAGFDAALLQRDTATVQLKIDQGSLWVRSPYCQQEKPAAWVNTGDLVEIRNGRVYFCGRADNAMINVGGQKAFPADIEACLMQHPMVVWVRVTARKAPLMGYLPAASVVLREPLDVVAAEQLLTAHCQKSLPDYAVPCLWDFPAAIPMQASMKS